jgi:general secretion pathway protein A
MHLLDMGYDKIKINPVYDDQTRAAVKKIQKKYGLKADGLVGPLTKIVLYNEKKSLKIPHITN